MSELLQKAAELRGVAGELLRLADECEAEAVAAGVKPKNANSGRHHHSTDWRKLKAASTLLKVETLYKIRRKRKAYLPAELFGEPGWDIMLDLFTAKLQNRKISITSACIAADVPPTTALRWVKLLEEMGFIERSSSEVDLRVNWVKLTDPATNMMQDLFCEIF